MDKIVSVGDRLRDYAIKTYGSLKAFAAKLEKSESNLSQYINDRRLPGNDLQQKLRELGADVEYIMTGKPSAASSTNNEAESLRDELNAANSKIVKLYARIEELEAENKFLRERLNP